MRRNGFTLIELLIGVVIATLCMAMMMMMFKQVSRTSLGSSSDAQYDTEIQVGLMVLQKYIQNAGYGSGNANDIALGDFAGNDAVFWRLVPDLNQPTVYQCQGVTEEVSQENSRYVHRLILLTRAACDNASSVESGTWTKGQTVVAIKKMDATPIYQYQLSSSNCMPYGIGDKTATKQQITIIADRQYITGTGESIQHTLCLNNLAGI